MTTGTKLQAVFPRPKRPYVVIPDGWNDGLRAALGRSGIDKVVSTIVSGDSFSQGVGASDIFANSWPARMKAGLLARGYPHAGDYYPLVASDDVFIISGASYRYGPTPAPWVVDATARSYFNGPFENVPVFTDTGVANKLVYTDPAVGYVDHDILMMGYATLTPAWDYSVDGGAAVHQNTLSGQNYAKIAVNGLSNNLAHVFRFGNQLNSQRMFVAGMLAWKSRARGLFFGNLGHVGQSLLAYINSVGGIPPDPFLVWSGWNGTDYTLGPPAAPDLWINAFGVNDCQSNTLGYGPLGFQLGLIRWIQAVRRGNPNAAIVLLSQAFPDYRYSDSTNGGGTTNALDWPLYVEAQYQVARHYGCALVDMGRKWGENSIANGYQTSDFHPTDAGHTDIANTMLSIL